VAFSKQLSFKHSFFAQLKWNAIKTSLDGWNPSPSQSICRKKMDPPWKPSGYDSHFAMERSTMNLSIA
jgi:hypothetical protein